jgi:DMSO/TMAO reductase YedYZ molybdopterin-dependent catalytic subunit
MEQHTLIALRLNGEPIPHIHGAPVRTIVPGWPGSLSQKWLTRLWVRDREHDGPGMGGTSYRVPVTPIVPGSRDDGRSFRDIHSMWVRSVLTNVANGSRFPAGTREIPVRGAAWAGEDAISAVHVSVDFGATWTAMEVKAPANKYAWQRWSGTARLPSDGYFEIWYRATDSRGRMQPHAAANWNPQGYGANPISRAAILVG